jgi:quercetin dioxygenase-like cupin family protein
VVCIGNGGIYYSKGIFKLIFIFFISVFFSCADVAVTSESNENNLSEKIEYAEKINNKVFFESENYKMILFAIKKDQVLKPHSAPMDTPLLVLEGSAKVTIGDEEFVLHEGDDIVLPKDIAHGVYPLSNVKFLLIK